VLLKSQPTVDPASVVVHFINFGDSALEVMVRGYILIGDWGEFTKEKERLNLEIMDIIHEMGLEIAFPSHSLYVEHLPDMSVRHHQAPEHRVHQTLSPEERAVLIEHPTIAPDGAAGDGDKS